MPHIDDINKSPASFYAAGDFSIYQKISNNLSHFPDSGFVPALDLRPALGAEGGAAGARAPVPEDVAARDQGTDVKDQKTFDLRARSWIFCSTKEIKDQLLNDQRS